MEENHLDVNVLPVLVEEVLQEVRHRLIGDVATDHNVPGKNTKSLEISGFCNVLDRHAPCTTCKVQTLKTKRKLVNFLKARNNDETGKAEGHITQRCQKSNRIEQYFCFHFQQLFHQVIYDCAALSGLCKNCFN